MKPSELIFVLGHSMPDGTEAHFPYLCPGVNCAVGQWLIDRWTQSPVQAARRFYADTATDGAHDRTAKKLAAALT